MAIAGSVERYLIQHQVPYDVMMHHHTRTSRATAHAAHIPGERLAKGVLVADDAGRPAMAVLPASHHLQLTALERLSGRRLRLMQKDKVEGFFNDCSAGAVPALGAAYGLETWLDDSLLQAPEIYFEAGDHELLLRVSRDCYLALLNPVHRAIFSHQA